MKITNEKELPQALVNVVKKTLHKPNHKGYGVTTLIGKDILEIILTRRYWNDIEEDITENVWAMYGNAFHEYIKAHDTTKYSEYRLENGKIIGVIDLYDKKKKKIVDYKTASVYKVKKQDYGDWFRQTLSYALLLYKKFKIKTYQAEIIVLMKDWSKSEAKRSKDYPQLPIAQITFSFGDEDYQFIDNYLTNKVNVLEKQRFTPTKYLPQCAVEFRWHKQDTWRIYKEGNKLPTITVWSEEEANKELKNLQESHPKNTYYIEFTKGKDEKCENYCKVNKFCPYYNKGEE